SKRDWSSDVCSSDLHQNASCGSIHDLVRFFDEFGIESRRKDIEVLEGRGNDFLVASFLEDSEDHVFQRTLLTGGDRQKGGNAFRNLRASGSLHDRPRTTDERV